MAHLSNPINEEALHVRRGGGEWKRQVTIQCVLSFHLGIKRDETLSSHFHVTLMEHFLEGYTPNPASLVGSGRTMWAVELQQSWEDFIHMYR